MLDDQPNQVWKLCFSLYFQGGGSDFRLYGGSDLKTYLLTKWYGPDAFAVVRPTRVYLLDFLCSGISFIYC